MKRSISTECAHLNHLNWKLIKIKSYHQRTSWIYLSEALHKCVHLRKLTPPKHISFHSLPVSNYRHRYLCTFAVSIIFTGWAARKVVVYLLLWICPSAALKCLSGRFPAPTFDRHFRKNRIRPITVSFMIPILNFNMISVYLHARHQ